MGGRSPYDHSGLGDDWDLRLLVATDELLGDPGGGLSARPGTGDVPAGSATATARGTVEVDIIGLSNGD